MDHEILQVIAEHLFREGHFEVGETFAREAGLEGFETLRQPYVSMHTILQHIRMRDLRPALAWASDHREKLEPDGRPSAFEFRLHQLGFVTVLQQEGQRPSRLMHSAP